ncbi:MAG: hypothetical protein Q9163_002001 [Psora crenata]
MDAQATSGWDELKLAKTEPARKQAYSQRPFHGVNEPQGGTAPTKGAVQAKPSSKKQHKYAPLTVPRSAGKAPSLSSYVALDIPPLGSAIHAQKEQQGGCNSKGGLVSGLSATQQPTKPLTYRPGYNLTPNKNGVKGESDDLGFPVTNDVSSQPATTVQPNKAQSATEDSHAVHYIPPAKKGTVLPRQVGVKAPSAVTTQLATPAHTFTKTSPVTRGTGYKNSRKSRLSSDPIIPMLAPNPTAAYLSQAEIPPTRLPTPQRLLLVLDLNGTLLSRKIGSTQYTPRSSLTDFLEYCCSNHSVLIWSSATPHNVNGICAQLFTSEQRTRLVGQWGRDTFGLTPGQYKKRVQVYKRLSRIWDSPHLLKYPHPHTAKGESWGQHNTVLIDDSAEKAASEPYNCIKVPEFTSNSKEKEDLLAQVVGWLEEARRWGDVSAFVGSMGKGFRVNAGWQWHWEGRRTTPLGEREGGRRAGSQSGKDGENDDDDDDEEDDGGVRLLMKNMKV